MARWVELTVRMAEAAVRKGVTEGVPSIAAQVAWYARCAMRRPPLTFPRWSLEEAAEAVIPREVSPRRDQEPGGF